MPDAQSGPFVDEKKIEEYKIYLVFIGLAVILLAMGMFYSPSMDDLWEGYLFILTHPSLADFDGLSAAGNYGTSFFNSGIVLLCTLMVLRLTKTRIQGVHIAAIMLMVGFSFYGKERA